jgi:predicted DsbA family dithiol-disulfide isomerase
MSFNTSMTVDPPTAIPPGNGMLNITAASQANRPTVNLIVVSDFNCPWCYVAHKEIQNALARARASHPNTLFTIEYRPFELDPTLPGAREKPMCRIACYKAKFGEEKMKKVSAVLKERGRQVGIDL